MNTKRILHRIVAAFLAVVLTMSLLPNEYMQKIGISSAVYAYDTNNILSISNSSATLQNGNIYKVTGNVSISRADGSAQAGLTVADGATVVLYIEEGCTLTVKGSAANGTIQGYPGIYIPVGSTLVVTGGGTLKATGGSAGNGTKGNNNQKTAIVKDASWDYINSGAGGNGGAGGAGAGAGIGGYGGNGGAGGAGAGYVQTGAYGGSDANCTGNPGGAGYQGGNGSSMGNLILLGNVTVNAVGGLASTTQGGVGTRYTDGPSGEGNTNYCANDSGSGWDTSYGSGCGGPGGGGGSGYGATGIGGGAAGAGGGGGGASGGNVGRGNKDNFGWSELGHAGQGGGGIGNVNGGGILNEGRINNGGYSGSGGAAGYAGGNGFFYKASTVTCSARNSDAGDSDSRVVNAKKLITNILTYSNETWAEGENANDVKEDVTFGYKIKSAEVPDIAKEKRGYTLRGYYTQPQGKGTKVINADGKTYVNESNKPLSDYLNKNGYWLGVYNTTLTAWYEPNKYNVTIDNTGGDGDNSLVVTYDDYVSNVSIPAWDGHLFDGYYTGKNGTGVCLFSNIGEPYRGTDYITDKGTWYEISDVTVYANWIEVEGVPAASETRSIFIASPEKKAENPGTYIDDTYYFGELTTTLDGELSSVNRVELRGNEHTYVMATQDKGKYGVILSQPEDFEVFIDGVDTGTALNIHSTSSANADKAEVHYRDAFANIKLNEEAYEGADVVLKSSQGDVAMIDEGEGQYSAKIIVPSVNAPDTEYKVYVDKEDTGSTMKFAPGANEASVNIYETNVITRLDNEPDSSVGYIMLKSGNEIMPEVISEGTCRYREYGDKHIYDIYVADEDTGIDVTSGQTKTIDYYSLTVKTTLDGELFNPDEVMLELGDETELPDTNKTGVYTLVKQKVDDVYDLSVNGEEVDSDTFFNAPSTVEAKYKTVRVNFELDGEPYDQNGSVVLVYKAPMMSKKGGGNISGTSYGLKKVGEGKYETVMPSSQTSRYDIYVNNENIGEVFNAADGVKTVEYFTLSLDSNEENGGKDVAGSEKIIAKKDDVANIISTGIPQDSETTFLGWSTEPNSKVLVDNDFVLTRTQTLYAVYSGAEASYKVNSYVVDKEGKNPVLAHSESFDAETDEIINRDKLTDLSGTDFANYHVKGLNDARVTYKYDETGTETEEPLAAKKQALIISVYYFPELYSVSYTIYEDEEHTTVKNSKLEEDSYAYGDKVSIWKPENDGQNSISFWMTTDNSKAYVVGDELMISGDMELWSIYGDSHRYNVIVDPCGGTNEDLYGENITPDKKKEPFVYDNFYSSSAFDLPTLSYPRHTLIGYEVFKLDGDRNKESKIGDISDLSAKYVVPQYDSELDAVWEWIPTKVTYPANMNGYTINTAPGCDKDNIAQNGTFTFNVNIENSYTCIDDAPVVKFRRVYEDYDEKVPGENADAEGYVEVTPDTEGNYTINSISTDVEIRVEGVVRDIAATVLDEQIPSQEYKGAELTPEFKISWINPATGNSEALTKNTDYVVSYSDNKWDEELKNDSKGKITVTGIGIYAGSAEYEFEIRDTVAPTVYKAGEGITVEDSGFRSFMNTITFKLFFKKTANVSIAASDVGSGIDSVEYMISETAYSAEDIKGTSVLWNKYNGKFNIDPNSKVIIYAKITDKAGNELFISSDGIVLCEDSIVNTEPVEYYLTSGKDTETDCQMNSSNTGSNPSSEFGGAFITPIDKEGKTGGETAIPDELVRYDETTGKIIVDSDFYENLEPGDYVINYIIHPLGVDGDDSNQVVPVKLTICAKDKAVISGLSAQDFNEGDNKSGVIGTAVVKSGEADITGDVSPLRYTYYTNEGLTNKTGTADVLGGAAYEGAVPTKEGTYYVKVDIEPDSKYTSEAVYRFSVLPLTEVSGHIDWDYRFNSKKDGEAKEYVLSGSDSRRSSRAEVVLLNHGEPVENKVEYVDITDTHTIFVESESVVDYGSGEYKFEKLPQIVDGLKASYSVAVTPLVVSTEVNPTDIPSEDYSITPNGYDAKLQFIYSGDKFDIVWDIDINNVEVVDGVKPECIYTQILKSDDGGQSFAPIDTMTGTNGAKSDIDDKGNCKGSYPYSKNADDEATYKLKITGYTVNGVFIDLSDANIYSEVKNVDYNSIEDGKVEFDTIDIETLPIPVIVFDALGGIASQDYILCEKVGETVSVADINGVTATKDYYDFEGWYTSSDLSEKVENDITVNSATTLYAGYKDITSPEGTITVESNKWKSFINSITFGALFKKSVDCTITATDEGDGVDGTFYYVLDANVDTPFTMSEVSALDDSKWTKGDKVSINPEGKFVVYAKVIDKAGNVGYLSTDGMIFDTTPPVLEGIEEGETYNGGITVIITEDNKEGLKLFVDGVPVELKDNGDGTFTAHIKGDGKEHTVKAVDGSGNVSYTIKATARTLDEVLPEIEEKFKDYENIENITSDDLDELKELLDDIEETLENAADDLTPEDKRELEEKKEKLNDDIEKLEKIAETIENIEDIVDDMPDKEHVTTDKADDIDDALEDITKLLDKPESLTKEEKEKLEDTKKELEELKDVIDELKQEFTDIEEKLDEIPSDVDKVTTEDEEKIDELIEAVDELLDNPDILTELEKEDLAELKEELKEKKERIQDVKENFDDIDEYMDDSDGHGPTSFDINQAISVIDNLLTENPDNLTQEQKDDLEQKKEEYEARKEIVIENETAIEEVKDDIDNLPADEDVTIENKGDIETVIIKLNEITDDPAHEDNLTNDQKKLIEEKREELQEKLDIINKVGEDIFNIDKRMGELPTVEDITPDSKDDVEYIENLINNLLTKNEGNLTDSQKEKLLEQKEKVEELADKIFGMELDDKVDKILTEADDVSYVEDPIYQRDPVTDEFILDENGDKIIENPGFTMEQKEKIDELLKDIDEVLTKGKNRLTTEQKENLKEVSEELKAAQKKINEVIKYCVKIRKQPANATILKNTSATFTIVIDSTYDLDYQWFVDTGDGRSFKAVRGATDTSMETGAMKLEDTGNLYKVRISGAFGYIDSVNAKLTVKSKVTKPAPSNVDPDDGNGSNAGYSGNGGSLNNGESGIPAGRAGAGTDKVFVGGRLVAAADDDSNGTAVDEDTTGEDSKDNVTEEDQKDDGRISGDDSDSGDKHSNGIDDDLNSGDNKVEEKNKTDNCHAHFYILGILLIYILAMLLLRKRDDKTKYIILGADIILALIIAIFGDCIWEWIMFAINTIVAIPVKLFTGRKKD